MIEVKFKTKNFQELIEKIKTELPNIVRQHLPDIVDESLDNLEAKAKALVPVRTGFLRSTIYGARTGELMGYVGATASYAFFVEFGTRFMNAKPYLRPALYNLIPELTTRMPYFINLILREGFQERMQWQLEPSL